MWGISKALKAATSLIFWKFMHNLMATSLLWRSTGGNLACHSVWESVSSCTCASALDTPGRVCDFHCYWCTVLPMTWPPPPPKSDPSSLKRALPKNSHVMHCPWVSSTIPLLRILQKGWKEGLLCFQGWWGAGIGPWFQEGGLVWLVQWVSVSWNLESPGTHGLFPEIESEEMGGSADVPLVSLSMYTTQESPWQWEMSGWDNDSHTGLLPSHMPLS